MADNETNYDSLVKKISALATRVGWECHTIYDTIEIAKKVVKDEILNGAGEAYDTLKELQDLINNNRSGIAALEALAAGHVHYDKEQTLTEEQKRTARTNIGATSGADTQALESRISTAESDIDALEGRMTTAEGNISTNASDIDTLEGRMDTAESNITSLGTRMTTAEGDIDALEAALGQPSDVDYVSIFESALNNGRPTDSGSGNSGSGNG